MAKKEPVTVGQFFDFLTDLPREWPILGVFGPQGGVHHNAVGAYTMQQLGTGEPTDYVVINFERDKSKKGSKNVGAKTAGVEASS